jgi:ubiquinone/menaquinone biosynthesis C-methylase UbiE
MSFSNPTIFDQFIELLFCHGFLRSHYKNFVKYVNLKGDETVLDFGCGGGSSSKFIVKSLSSKGKLICNDTSSIWINKCKKRLKKYHKIKFIADDLTKINRLEIEKVDVVYIHYVLHDLSEYKQNDIIRYLSKKVKNNGIICIKEPTKLSHGMRVEQIRERMNKYDFYEKKSKQLKSYYMGLFELENDQKI